MVKVSDCTCCDCDSAQEKEQIKERALSSINKIWTTDAKTYYPDGTGMVTLPIPSMEQIDQISINAEHIAANTADITALNAEMEDVQGTVGKIPTGYTLYRDGEGKIRLQAEATDGSLINSNVLDMIIPYQYDLISGTTSRSFKLNIVMSDGSSYTTNDFVIPEGGGTDVTVTGIVLSKDQGDVNRFHVGINLSDSTMIDSGYISMVDNVAATYADGKLTISVNGVSSVPVAVDVTGEFIAGDGIKIESGTISISDELAERLTTIEGDIATLESDVTNVLTVANRAFDAVTLADNVLTLERGNGGTESVTLPSSEANDFIKISTLNDIDFSKIKVGSTFILGQITSSNGDITNGLFTVKRITSSLAIFIGWANWATKSAFVYQFYYSPSSSLTFFVYTSFSTSNTITLAQSAITGMYDCYISY